MPGGTCGDVPTRPTKVTRRVSEGLNPAPRSCVGLVFSPLQNVWVTTNGCMATNAPPTCRCRAYPAESQRARASVNERERSGVVTLSVEEPGFPLDDVSGSEMVLAESAAATMDVAEEER